jgi:hypothetical protein
LATLRAATARMAGARSINCIALSAGLSQQQHDHEHHEEIEHVHTETAPLYKRKAIRHPPCSAHHGLVDIGVDGFDNTMCVADASDQERCLLACSIHLPFAYILRWIKELDPSHGTEVDGLMSPSMVFDKG